MKSKAVVCAGSNRFALGERTFCLFGFNAYYLAYCSDVVQRTVLQHAVERGANTIRAWAFESIESAGGLVGLDSLLAQAEEAGIFLILPLINGWSDFSGMPSYAPGGSFFVSEHAMDAYERWVERLLTRRNAVTGRRYSEEPAILAWELANEPRLTASLAAAALIEWVERASSHIKQLDPSHLLAVGDEGFFSRRFARRNPLRPGAHLYDGRYGVDAKALLSLSAIDFGTYHLYPENWNVRPSFGTKWIREHVTLAIAVGKPVVLEEFGLPASVVGRLDIYQEWFRAACNGGGGALLWMVGCNNPESARFCDRYTLKEFPAGIDLTG